MLRLVSEKSERSVKSSNILSDKISRDKIFDTDPQNSTVLSVEILSDKVDYRYAKQAGQVLKFWLFSKDYRSPKECVGWKHVFQLVSIGTGVGVTWSEVNVRTQRGLKVIIIQMMIFKVQIQGKDFPKTIKLQTASQDLLKHQTRCYTDSLQR